MNIKLTDYKFFEELFQEIQEEKKKLKTKKRRSNTTKTRSKPKNIYQAVAKESRQCGEDEDKLETRLQNLGITDLSIRTYITGKENYLKDLKELPKKMYVYTKAEQKFLDTNGKFYNKIYIYDHERHTKPKYIIYQETTNSNPYTIKRYRQYTYGIGSKMNPKEYSRLCEKWRRENNIK